MSRDRRTGRPRVLQTGDPATRIDGEDLFVERVADRVPGRPGQHGLVGVGNLGLPRREVDQAASLAARIEQIGPQRNLKITEASGHQLPLQPRIIQIARTQNFCLDPGRGPPDRPVRSGSVEHLHRVVGVLLVLSCAAVERGGPAHERVGVRVGVSAVGGIDGRRDLGDGLRGRDGIGGGGADCQSKDDCSDSDLHAAHAAPL